MTGPNIYERWRCAYCPAEVTVHLGGECQPDWITVDLAERLGWRTGGAWDDTLKKPVAMLQPPRACPEHVGRLYRPNWRP